MTVLRGRRTAYARVGWVEAKALQCIQPDPGVVGAESNQPYFSLACVHVGGAITTHTLNTAFARQGVHWYFCAPNLSSALWLRG